MSFMTNPLATADQLYRRSSYSSLPVEIQDTILYQTQCLTSAAGVLLELPQSTTAQANILLARYWLLEDQMSYDFDDTSAAVLFLVSKLSSTPRRTRDIANVYAYLLSPASSFQRPKDQPPPVNDPTLYHLDESTYAAFTTVILRLEAHILAALSFDTHVSLPHPLAITYLQSLDFLGFSPREKIAKEVVKCLNTALLSPQMLALTHQPHALAAAAIYAAAKEVGARMPDVEWWEVFDVDREELGFLVVGMRSLEGWVRKQMEEHPKLWGNGMIMARTVKEEVDWQEPSLGSPAMNGKGDGEEARMMREMDERGAS